MTKKGSFSSAGPHSLALISLHFIRHCGEPQKNLCALVLSCAWGYMQQSPTQASPGLFHRPLPPSLSNSPLMPACSESPAKYAIWTPRTHHCGTAKRTPLSHKRREGKTKKADGLSFHYSPSCPLYTSGLCMHTRTALHGRTAAPPQNGPSDES